MKSYVVKTVTERLVAWREAEKAASDAEHKVAGFGRAETGDSAFRELCFAAKGLREAADREFAAILRAVRMDERRETYDRESSGTGDSHASH